MTLIPDLPSSEGVRNGLKRAKRLVEAAYTPVRPFPLVYAVDINETRSYQETYSVPYLPLRGIQYSSVRRSETYVGCNVSFETFYTALANPRSVLYTRPIEGTGQNVHARYGIVCSCFASEVLDIPYRTPCIRWPELKGVTKVDAGDLKNLRLLDIVLNVKKHIAIVTGIERDETGEVQRVTVSESVLPLCRAVTFTPEEFRGYWLERGFEIYRYEYLDRIPYEPDRFIPIEEDGELPAPVINRDLMLDYGNKANYRLGEPVEIDVYHENCCAVDVVGPDGRRERHTVEWETKQSGSEEKTATFGTVVLRPDVPGFYKVIGVGDGVLKEPLEFCVTDLSFTLDKPRYQSGETITLRYENTASDPVVAYQCNLVSTDRGCGGESFSPYLDGRGGTIELVCPDREGAVELYIIAKNAYGAYTSERVRVKE